MVLGRAWDFTQSGERSPNRVWSRRVECRFTDTDTETQKAGWFPWGYRLGSVQQGSGIWIYISVFPSDGRLHRLSSVLGVFRQPVIRSLVGAGWIDICSWLSLVPKACSQDQPAPAFSFQTTCPLPAVTRVSLSPSTLFPGLNLLFQAHSFRCRFCELPGISDLNGKDLFWEFLSGWRMIWGQLEIRAHGRHLLLLLPSPNWRQEGKHS